jgi:multidrug resistance efflux pump
MVDVGATVQEGAPLVEVADLAARRVEAEVGEFDLAAVALGGVATVGAEAFPGQSWHATIEEVPEVVVPRRIRPQDPARLSDTRVLLVKLAIDPSTPLKLGQRVDVQLDAAVVTGAAVARH